MSGVTAEPAWPTSLPPGPFDLNNGDAYRRWRDAKLATYPRRFEELVVEVRDPRQLTAAEHAELLRCCRRANMAVYAGATRDNADSEIPRRVGAQFGLVNLDHNPGADDAGITAITVVQDSGYIPYSNRPIRWHTDGYYNRPDRQIRAMLLHCVITATEGGESGLLDHEMAYIQMRDAHPEYVAALMAADVMTIPGNMDDPRVLRPDRTGPIFWVDPQTATLQMRYTARKRNIVWRDDEVVRAAVAFLEGLMSPDSPYLFRATLAPGQGLICNNVLHDRTGFHDNGPARLLYRGRYYDRIAGTELAT
ncbi:MAG: TauD/TfdA family dioxygenase [Nitrospirota bacterium]|jgi:hypothetical protein